jgi:spore coat polysaccharide biosynthesis protein SpsF
MDICGEPMLARVMKRLQRANFVDGLLVATTTEPEDDTLANICVMRGWLCYRGSRDNVLDRYYQAASKCGADVVVRVTSDCPLIDPQVVDQVVSEFHRSKVDYASNTLIRTYPRGLDTEAMTMAALEKAFALAKDRYQCEHVTPYLYQNPQQFRLWCVEAEANYSHHRWTVDMPEDLALIRAIYDRLDGGGLFGWRKVLGLLDREPCLSQMNQHIQQKPLGEG